jgi:carbonic anhydrase/acetyltransferase-like protein (isoleucine patch superfamily)
MVISLEGHRPSFDTAAFVAPGAVLIGRVTVGAESSIWYGAVLRGDTETITIGAQSNIQDGAVVHADPGFPATIGDRVSVGHGAIVHGATVGDDVLVGMASVLMNGSVIGPGSLVAAGAVVTPGTVVPPGSLVAGVPGRVVRPVTDEDATSINRNAATYLRLAALHAAETSDHPDA